MYKNDLLKYILLSYVLTLYQMFFIVVQTQREISNFIGR